MHARVCVCVVVSVCQDRCWVGGKESEPTMPRNDRHSCGDEPLPSRTILKHLSTSAQQRVGYANCGTFPELVTKSPLLHEFTVKPEP